MCTIDYFLLDLTWVTLSNAYFSFVDVLQTSLQQLQQLQQLQLLQTPTLTSSLAPFVLTGASSLAQSKVGAFNWIAGLPYSGMFQFGIF